MYDDDNNSIIRVEMRPLRCVESSRRRLVVSCGGSFVCLLGFHRRVSLCYSNHFARVDYVHTDAGTVTVSIQYISAGRSERTRTRTRARRLFVQVQHCTVQYFEL